MSQVSPQPTLCIIDSYGQKDFRMTQISDSNLLFIRWELVPKKLVFFPQSHTAFRKIKKQKNKTLTESLLLWRFIQRQALDQHLASQNNFASHSDYSSNTSLKQETRCNQSKFQSPYQIHNRSFLFLMLNLKDWQFQCWGQPWRYFKQASHLNETGEIVFPPQYLHIFLSISLL